LVTGGGGGIGRAVSERLARDGARVEIAEIDASRGVEVADAIEGQGGRARAAVLDVADASRSRTRSTGRRWRGSIWSTSFS
jgi:NAD(P)-dependent dehydrogenase (short-subunit alcohol dehydrogenase family)